MPTEPATRPTALLLMDLQGRTMSTADDPATLVAAANRAAAAARAAAIPVVFVVVQFRPGHPEVSPDNHRFRLLKDEGALMEGTHDTSLAEGLILDDRDLVVVKRRTSAFAGSDLDVILRSWGTRSLVMGGIATSGVVLSTVRAAADLDFRLTVLADLCADHDAEVHDVLLRKILRRHADITTSEAWAAGLGGRGGLDGEALEA